MKFLIRTTQQGWDFDNLEDSEVVLERPCPQAYSEAVEWKEWRSGEQITIVRNFWFIDIDKIEELVAIAPRLVIIFSESQLLLEKELFNAAGCPWLEIYNDYRE